MRRSSRHDFRALDAREFLEPARTSIQAAKQTVCCSGILGHYGASASLSLSLSASSGYTQKEPQRLRNHQLEGRAVEKKEGRYMPKRSTNLVEGPCPPHFALHFSFHSLSTAFSSPVSPFVAPLFTPLSSQLSTLLWNPLSLQCPLQFPLHCCSLHSLRHSPLHSALYSTLHSPVYTPLSTPFSTSLSTSLSTHTFPSTPPHSAVAQVALALHSLPKSKSHDRHEDGESDCSSPSKSTVSCERITLDPPPAPCDAVICHTICHFPNLESLQCSSKTKLKPSSAFAIKLVLPNPPC